MGAVGRLQRGYITCWRSHSKRQNWDWCIGSWLLLLKPLCWDWAAPALVSEATVPARGQERRPRGWGLPSSFPWSLLDFWSWNWTLSQGWFSDFLNHQNLCNGAKTWRRSAPLACCQESGWLLGTNTFYGGLMGQGEEGASEVTGARVLMSNKEEGPCRGTSKSEHAPSFSL